VKRLPTCPRCGGQLLSTLDGHGCLQCGHQIIEVASSDLELNHVPVATVRSGHQRHTDGWHDIDTAPYLRR
jgi:tRNA(Ile2) C34 agmatinyltransferase TiaS